jgi:hypothetical protein
MEGDGRRPIFTSTVGPYQPKHFPYRNFCFDHLFFENQRKNIFLIQLFIFRKSKKKYIKKSHRLFGRVLLCGCNGALPSLFPCAPPQIPHPRTRLRLARGALLVLLAAGCVSLGFEAGGWVLPAVSSDTPASSAVDENID